MILADQIAALQNMPTGELAAEYTRLFGKPPRYRSVPWIRKRIAHKLQTVAYGGLPRAARAALDALGADILVPAAPAPNAAPTATSPRGVKPGTVLRRVWHGRQVLVEVTVDGFIYDSERYDSLSAVAKRVTGQHWSGPRFFNLTERKRA